MYTGSYTNKSSELEPDLFVSDTVIILAVMHSAFSIYHASKVSLEDISIEDNTYHSFVNVRDFSVLHSRVILAIHLCDFSCDIG